MTSSPPRRRWAALVLAAALTGTACGQSTPSATMTGPSPTRPSPSVAASSGTFEPMRYPLDGPAPCDQPGPPDATHAAYRGTIRQIRAVDPATVEIELCRPDPGLPTRLALQPFAINDTAWLQSRIDPGGSGAQEITRAVNGTGPWRLEGWNGGSDLALVRNQAYWGVPASSERLIVRWQGDASARLGELAGGSVDGIDAVASDDVDALVANVELQAAPRVGMNVFYVGFNNTFAPFDNVKVRQAIALAIDRQRIVETLYPAGSEVASHFAPCAVAFGCEGPAWYDLNAAGARQLLSEAGFRDGFRTTIQYRDAPRPYLPDATAVATELRVQLLTNLNIEATLEVVPDDAFLTRVDEGLADGIHLLGRTTTVPEASSLLDPHFGAGASREFGEPIDAVVDALAATGATADPGARAAAFGDANTALRTNVPMIPIAHAGSMTAYRADVAGVKSSPVAAERFAALVPGDRRQIVWLAAGEPEGLYCADETAPEAWLVCAQATEGLYAFVPGSAAVLPALALGCEANPELTIWTCALRPGVTFHDGTVLDANDVVLSLAVQWDAEHPLHAGRNGRFQPFIDTFGGLLNPPSGG